MPVSTSHLPLVQFTISPFEPEVGNIPFCLLGCPESQVQQGIGNNISTYITALIFHHREAHVLCRNIRNIGKQSEKM